MIPAEGTLPGVAGDGAQPAARRGAAPRRVQQRAAAAGTAADVSGRDVAALLFAGEMYGLQLDHLAAVLAVPQPRARAIAARWRSRRLAESARLGPGLPWVWLARPGLASCGLRYSAAAPALGRLAHIRAVSAVRLALERTSGYRAGGAYWRGERRLRALAGGRVGLRDHFPDGEVHWPDAADVPWAGECWALEAELTAKTVGRTVTIMRELLSRTGDYGCAAAHARVPGEPPRHARLLYVCSPAAARTVTRARDALGADAARIEIRSLPPDAYLAPP